MRTRTTERRTGAGLGVGAAIVLAGCAQVQEAVEGPAPLATAERLVTPAPEVLAPEPCTVDLVAVLAPRDPEADAPAFGWPPLVAGSTRLDLGTPVTVPQSPQPTRPTQPEEGDWIHEHVVRLGDLVSRLQSQTRVPVEVRWRELEAAGHGPDLGLDLPAGTITLAAVMESAVRASEREAAAAAASDEVRDTLAWVLGDDRLLLTTLADARARAAAWAGGTTVERRYPLAAARAAMIAVHREDPAYPALRQAATRTLEREPAERTEPGLSVAARRLLDAEPPIADEIDAELAALDELVAGWLARPAEVLAAIEADSVDELRAALSASGVDPRTVRATADGLLVQATPAEHAAIVALLEELSVGCRLPRIVAEAAGTTGREGRGDGDGSGTTASAGG